MFGDEVPRRERASGHAVVAQQRPRQPAMRLPQRPEARQVVLPGSLMRQATLQRQRLKSAMVTTPDVSAVQCRHCHQQWRVRLAARGPGCLASG